MELRPDGNIAQVSAPTRTQVLTTYEIRCAVNDSNEVARGSVSLESKGLDWVRVLTSTGFESSGFGVRALNPNEIYFLTRIMNNGANLGTDFGISLTKSSSPTHWNIGFTLPPKTGWVRKHRMDESFRRSEWSGSQDFYR